MKESDQHSAISGQPSAISCKLLWNLGAKKTPILTTQLQVSDHAHVPIQHWKSCKLKAER